jgi:hypothetical protein
MACEIGVLFASAPSPRIRPLRHTAGSSPGIAVLARMALQASPSDSSTSSPDSMFVATT